MDPESIFFNIPKSIPTELHHPILETDTFRLVRIVSKGHATPVGSWLYEVDDEWIYLVQGRSKLIFEDDNKETEMSPGDYLFIPAFKRHRVEWTDPDKVTIWLAVYLKGNKEIIKTDTEY
jgi:cupin 2 domain-containing protein